MIELVLGIGLLAMINFSFKAAGPALLLDREPSPAVRDVLVAFSPALLAGLVIVELAGPGWSELDWTTLPPLAVAAAAYLKGAPDLLCVLLAAAVAIGLRALTG